MNGERRLPRCPRCGGHWEHDEPCRSEIKAEALAPKWEYTIKQFGADFDANALNTYGDFGWELAAVYGNGLCVFKRPLP